MKKALQALAVTAALALNVATAVEVSRIEAGLDHQPTTNHPTIHVRSGNDRPTRR